MAIVPGSRPQRRQNEVAAQLRALGVEEDLALLGVRGYYRDTMGKKGANDRGIYDDAIFLVTPTAFLACNANTDPSAVFRPGLACLQPGRWAFEIGIHGRSRPKSQQYRALIQASSMRVRRDGTDAVPAGTQDSRGRCAGGGLWDGWFGLNLHRGGFNTTSSLGCQTIHPTQWPAFFALVEAEMKRHGARRIPYALVDEVAR